MASITHGSLSYLKAQCDRFLMSQVVSQLSPAVCEGCLPPESVLSELFSQPFGSRGCGGREGLVGSSAGTEAILTMKIWRGKPSLIPRHVQGSGVWQKGKCNNISNKVNNGSYQ